MKNIFLILLSLHISFVAFSQWDASKLELPPGGDNFIELKPMTGIIYIKNLVNDYWIEGVTTEFSTPQYFGIVQFARDRLNISIYKSNGELISSFFLKDVSFTKQKKRYSDTQEFTLNSKSKFETAKIEITSTEYLPGFTVKVVYNSKINGEDDVDLLLYYKKTN